MALTKPQAAFRDALAPKPRCTSCCAAPMGTSCALPEIDEELLRLRFTGKGLRFLSQDEDLVVAEADTGLLIRMIGEFGPGPARVAVSALMVKVHDGEDPGDEALQWLAANRDAWPEDAAETGLGRKLLARIAERGPG